MTWGQWETNIYMLVKVFWTEQKFGTAVSYLTSVLKIKNKSWQVDRAFRNSALPYAYLNIGAVHWNTLALAFSSAGEIGIFIWSYWQYKKSRYEQCTQNE